MTPKPLYQKPDTRLGHFLRSGFSQNQKILVQESTQERKNFDNIKICGQSSAQMKMTDMERSGLAAVLSLVEGSGAVDLESVFSGRVIEESLSLFSADGSMRKTAKSKLLDYFSLEPTSTTLDDYVSIIDMGMIWRLASPTAEDREAKRRDGDCYRWIHYLTKIHDLIISRHPRATTIILVNDRYDLSHSIKDDEHNRRIAKHVSQPNKYPNPKKNSRIKVTFSPS